MRLHSGLATSFLAALALSPSVLAQAPTALAPTGQIKHLPITEMSGVVKSRRYPDTYWVHNDSGDSPRLFAIHTDGSVIMPPWLKKAFYTDTPDGNKPPFPGIPIAMAANSDWEDIAIDGDTLYIADTGNNGNARRDLGVYVVAEPNPAATESTRAAKWVPIAYPDQQEFPPRVWHFDCEAIFVVNHKLYFLTKWRFENRFDKPDVGAALYRLDSAYTDKVNVLKKLDSRADLGGWVTAADVSPDGKTLAVLCESPTKSVWLFDITKGDRMLSHPTGRLLLAENAQQCEAICFDDNGTVIVGNEQRDLFRIPLARFASVAK